MYYLCSENKGAAQLHGYRAADLSLCFSHMQKSGSHITWLMLSVKVAQLTPSGKESIRLVYHAWYSLCNLFVILIISRFVLEE